MIADRSSSKDRPVVRCAVYTRKSSDENLNLDFNSLDAQRESGEAYIKSQQHEGWIALEDRYDDGGFTGGNMDRPAFQRLMADVRARRVDCIVVYKIDRLSRSLMDFAKIMETLEANGVSVVSVTQQFNTTSSMGRLTLNILLSFAQFEREIISERTRDKIGAARRKGKWIGGPPVLGYDRLRDTRGTRLCVNAKEAERVRAIYRKYAECGSLQATLNELVRLNWQTKRYTTSQGRVMGGSAFSKSSLERVLTNVLYLGKVTYKDEIHDGEHDAIIDEGLFAQAQGLLRRNWRSGGKHVRNKYGALLRGLVRCKSCGCAMTHNFSKGGKIKYRYYVCVNAQKRGWAACPSPSIPAKELESFVIDQIRQIGCDRGILEDAVRATQGQMEKEIQVAKHERRSLQAKVTELGRQVGQIASRAGYDREATQQMESLQSQIRQVQVDIAEISKTIVDTERRMLSSDELTGALEAFDPLWESLSPERRMRLVHLLIRRVEYDGPASTVAVTFHPTGIGSLMTVNVKE